MSEELDKNDILKAYKEELAITEDDTVLMTVLLKMSRVDYKILDIGEQYSSGEMTPYEGLARLDALMEIIGLIRHEVKNRL